ncbi:MAG: hypothetical protein H7288_10770 [Kineosporiaceae bacterium]|nr:hypothetical protein [Aeromicrobium sp.]
MTWNFVAPIAAEEDTDGLFPLLSSTFDVMPEPLDGQLSTSLSVFQASVTRMVNGSFKEQVNLSDLKLEAHFTESRFVLYCRKWSKGGFIGSTDPIGLLLAATTAAVSAARAANRRKGTALAGHLHWEALRAVAWRPRTMWDTNAVSLAYLDNTDGEEVRCRILLEFRRNVDAQEVARQILDRALAYRFSSNEEFTAEETENWEAIRTSGPIVQANKGLNWVTLPTSWPIGGTGFTPPTSIQFPAVARA